jgi:hypothetical protein
MRSAIQVITERGTSSGRPTRSASETRLRQALPCERDVLRSVVAG